MLPSLASLPEGLQQALTMQEEQVSVEKLILYILNDDIDSIGFSGLPDCAAWDEAVTSGISPLTSIIAVFIKCSHPPSHKQTWLISFLSQADSLILSQEPKAEVAMILIMTMIKKQ